MQTGADRAIKYGKAFSSHRLADRGSSLALKIGAVGGALSPVVLDYPDHAATAEKLMECADKKPFTAP